MTISVSASALAKTSYNFNESVNSAVRSDYESITSNASYSYGSGYFEINAAVKNTGVLPSGGSAIFNINSMTKQSIGITSTVAFTGIKNVTIYNSSTTMGRDIAIRATGSNALTNMFNGGSGNLLIKPYSSFSYNDPYGLAITGTQKNISLVDVSGSGASYEICVMGNM